MQILVHYHDHVYHLYQTCILIIYVRFIQLMSVTVSKCDVLIFMHSVQNTLFNTTN